MMFKVGDTFIGQRDDLPVSERTYKVTRIVRDGLFYTINGFEVVRPIKIFQSWINKGYIVKEYNINDFTKEISEL